MLIGSLFSETTNFHRPIQISNLWAEFMNSNQILRGEYTDSKGFLHREYEDAQGNVHTEFRDEQGTLHTYQYAYDPAISSRLQSEREAKAQSNGVLIGALIVALGSLLAGAIYVLTRPTPPDPLQVINVESPEPDAALPPEAPAAEPPTINVESAPQPPAQQDINITTTAPAPNPSSPSVVVVPSPTSPAPAPTSSAPNPSTPQASSSAPANSGNTITDGALKTNISKAFKDKWPNNQLTVEVQNGVVTVSGKAANQAQLDQIETMIEAIAGVKGMMIKATTS